MRSVHTIATVLLICAAVPVEQAAMGQPAPASAQTAGAEAIQPTTQGGAEITIGDGVVLQYAQAPIASVVRSFSQRLGKPLIAKCEVKGEITFSDSRPYTMEDAFDTINILLAARGYQMAVDGRYLYLVTIGEVATLPTPILRGLDDTDALREEQLVSVVLKLENLEPDEAAKLIAQMVSTYGSIAPLTKTRALLVTDRLGKIRQIENMLKVLDAVGKTPEAVIKYIRLKNAKAAEVGKVISQLWGAEAILGARGQGRERPPVTTEAAVRIAIDESMNTLILMGTPDNLAVAEELIRRFDIADPDRRTVMEIVSLANAQAVNVARAVSATFVANAATGSRRPGPMQQTTRTEKVTVAAEPDSNSILVRGPADEVSAVVAAIRSLDVPSPSEMPQLRTYKLTNNDAGEVAGTLGKLFTSIISQTPRPSVAPRRPQALTVPFSISADTRTNSLLVSTTPAYFAMFEELLNELEQTETPMRDVHYVQLVNADAYDLASKLNNLFAESSGPDKPIVEADSFSNTLTIIAKEIDFKRMEPVIASIDSVQVRRVAVIAVTGLPAEQLAEQLSRVYLQISDSEVRVVEQLSAPTAATGPATEPASGQTYEQPGKEILRSDDTNVHGQNQDLQPQSKPGRPVVLIAVDKTTNSLIVSASRQDVEAIENLIIRLSAAAQTAETELRWFKVQHADPQWVADTLEQLFNPPKPKAKPAPVADKAAEKDKDEAKAAPAVVVSAAQPTMTVIADTRTRHVIVRARPAELDRVEKILPRIDVPPAFETAEVMVVPLLK
ncbi:MAG: hypothetical protein HQ546_05790, partial [Planctomycetes bacterium]|nr:hypothetical protein [Planctomycetota bacterium]